MEEKQRLSLYFFTFVIYKFSILIAEESEGPEVVGHRVQYLGELLVGVVFAGVDCVYCPVVRLSN